MNKFRITLLAAALLLLALPPVFGMLTETQVRERIDTLNANEQLDVRLESYDRGWFTSRALLSVAPPQPADPSVGETFAALFSQPMAVAVDFNHGPVSLQDGFFLGVSELLARPAAEQPGAAAGDPGGAPIPFEFEAQSTFGGDLHFLARLLPFDRDIGADSVSFSGGSIGGTVTGRRITARAQAETFQYRTGAATLSVQGVAASADNELLTRYLMPGTVELSVQRASVELGLGAASSPVFDASGISFTSSTALDADAGLLDGTVSLGFDRTRVGSDTDITDAAFEAAAQSLDVPALGALYAAYAEGASTPGGQSPPPDAIEPAIVRLLEREPSASVDPLRFDWNGDAFEAEVFLEANPAAWPVDLDDGGLWATLVNGTAELSAAKPLAERLAVQIVKSQLTARLMEGDSIPFEALDTMAEAQAGLVLTMLSAQGLLEDTGSLYRARVVLENGLMTINGQPLPFGL